MDDCIFCKIAKKELRTEFLYQDEDVVAFHDIHPVRPIHLVIIPTKHIADLINVDSPILFEKLFMVVARLVREYGLEGKGYRVVINGGGAQIIHHLHIHLMGPINKEAKL